MRWIRDPNGTAARVITVLGSTLAVIGYEMTDDLKTALITVVAGIMSLASVLWARRYAYKQETVNKEVADAIANWVSISAKASAGQRGRESTETGRYWFSNADRRPRNS